METRRDQSQIALIFNETHEWVHLHLIRAQWTCAIVSLGGLLNLAHFLARHPQFTEKHKKLWIDWLQYDFVNPFQIARVHTLIRSIV